MPTNIQKDVFLQPVALPRTGPGPCERREITISTNNGLFSRFCCVSIFGNRIDPVVPTLRSAKGDVVIAYAYSDTKGHCLPSLVYQGLVKARAKDVKSLFPPIMAYMCTWSGTKHAYAIFPSGQLKDQSIPNLFFFHIMTTHNHHPS